MTTPTSNPVPSGDPRDLLFNAEKTDEFVNSSNDEYEDRFGGRKFTAAGGLRAAVASIVLINDRGAWASTTAYAVKDVVSSGGAWYFCVSAHTSGASFAGDQATRWRVYPGITSPVFPGAATRTQEAKNADIISVTDGSGTDMTGATESTAGVNAAVAAAAALRGRVERPGGRVIVGAGYANNTGVRIDGRLEQTRAGNGTRILQSYADWDQRVVGLEYLYRVHQVMFDAAAGPIKVKIHGNSATQGGNGESAGYKADSILANVALDLGARSLLATNLAVSGTSVSDVDTSSWLADMTVSCVILKFGLNEGQTAPSGDALESFCTAYRAKLASIRATRSVNDLTIIVVSDNTANDAANGRDEQWIEKTSLALRMIARDYQCCFYDSYGDFRDAENASAWMDNPYGDGRHIHPLDRMQSWTWGRVAGLICSQTEARINRVRFYTSEHGQYTNNASPASDFPLGISYWRARGSTDNFPFDGLLEVVRHWDGVCVQRLSDYRSGGDHGYVITRVWSNQSGAWKDWSGQKDMLAYANGWQDFGSGWEIGHRARSVDGIVSLGGRVKSGTTTAGTTIATIPLGFRPAAARTYLVATSAGAGAVDVFPDGAIKVNSGVSATWTSLDGVVFHAAL